MDLWDDRPPKPKRPPNVCEPGQLIVPRWFEAVPVLVLDVQPFWGNPNGDNTADHWYWRYYIMCKEDNYGWCSAKDWRLFQAR